MNEQIAKREKYWDELTDAEKIARLRDVVRSLRDDNDRLARRVSAMRRHQHASNGDLMVPYGLSDESVPERYRPGRDWL